MHQSMPHLRARHSDSSLQFRQKQFSGQIKFIYVSACVHTHAQSTPKMGKNSSLRLGGKGVFSHYQFPYGNFQQLQLELLSVGITNSLNKYLLGALMC